MMQEKSLFSSNDRQKILVNLKRTSENHNIVGKKTYQDSES